jgi:acetyl esterase/lipase
MDLDLDRGLPGSCGLVAIYPMLDPDTTWDKHEGATQQGDKDTLRRGWDTYLSRLQGLPAEQQKHAKLLLLSAEDLGRLSPTYLDVGSHDYFKEEVLQAVKILKDANVKVTAEVLEGMPHSFESRLYKLDPGNEVLQKAWKARRLFLQKIFGMPDL